MKFIHLCIVHLLYFPILSQNATILKDNRPGNMGSNPFGLTSIGNNLYFVCNDGTHGAEMWVSDGTADGTRLIKDISVNASNQPNSIRKFGTRCAFIQNDGNGPKLWITDGSDINTYAVSPPNATGISIYDNPVFKEHIYYLANIPNFRFHRSSTSPNSYENLPWDEALSVTNNSTPISFFTPCNNNAYFSHSNWPYFYESTTDTVISIAVPEVSSAFIFPNNLACNAVDKLFYTAVVSPSNRQLMVDGDIIFIRNDGQSAFSDINSSAEFVFLNNGDLLFIANDGIHGLELWRSDGTPNGTFMVKDIRQGAQSSFPTMNSTSPPKIFFAVGNEGKYLFRVNDGTHGEEWYITDGTEAGTQLVKDIREGAQTSAIDGPPLSYEGKVYFTCSFPGSQRELWVTDGTEQGTFQLTNIRGGEGNAEVSNIEGHNGKIYFAANDGVHGRELWVYDPDNTSISDLNTPLDFSMWPNPAENLVNISFNGLQQNFTFKVLDINGRIILQNKVKTPQHELYIGDWKNGLYIVQIDTGKHLLSKKLVVIH